MANLNINRNVTDVFYRYKMPRLIAKVEGKGNGIKTVIVNMSDIAKALSRPPTYPTKYFGCELGAQTQFDVKNDRFIVNGSHESVKLQELLDGFIRKFVLCQECDNPETNLTVKKSMIVQRCIACGHSANIDMRHKLTTYILKNPPEPSDGVGTTTTTTTAEPVKETPGKRSKRGKGSKETENGNGDTNAERQTSHESNHDSKESRKSASAKKDDDDDGDWCEDTSDAAVQARMEALSGAAKTMTISDDLEKSQQERVDMFYSYVKQKKASDSIVGAEREKEIVSEAERLDIKDKAPLVLAELLYDSNMLQQIKTYRSLLIRFTKENVKAQRYLLGGFEQLVGNVHRDALLPKVPHILKDFYEADILDEEVILEWNNKSSKFVSKDVSKEIHAKAAPFITWLNEAEEESSEEDENEDDGVEVVYTNSESPGVVTIPAKGDKPSSVKTNDNNAINDDDDEDAINIDDI